MSRRASLFLIGIFLPSFLLLVGGVFFLTDKVPSLVRDIRAEQALGNRERAMEVWRAPDTADYMGPRPKGWRQVGKLGEKGGAQVSWGCNEIEGRPLVWVGGLKFVVGNWLDQSRSESWVVGLYGAVIGIIVLAVTISIFCAFFLHRVTQEREEFVLAALHDLRTPVAALQILLRQDSGDVHLAVEHIRRVLANLNEFLHMRAARHVLKSENFDLAAAYHKAYALLAADFAEELSGPVACRMPEEPIVVCGDEQFTIQILWNLLGNALKYAAPFGPVSAELGTTSDGLVFVRLADTGKGMSSRERRHAFDRYFRAKNSLACGRGGFGIGLPVSRTMARMMGGDLTVAANVPQGCVFTLTLPQK